MKKIEECLDLVLQSLVDNGGIICINECKDAEACAKGNVIPSIAYNNLFEKLDMNNIEACQLLGILKENDYLKFVVISGVLYSSIFCEIKSGGTPGNTNMNENTMNLAGKPDKIELNLKGKFFIQNGGYLGKIRKEERNELLQKLAIWITAIGTGLGGVYLIGKALFWVMDNFQY
ncbi:MAG TPA: hypothetical protein VK806_07185 [Bacteroidia bacterium]|jgi:hypothetical protein|nr:hypothetical protein [Bacteroidia bacterium]